METLDPNLSEWPNLSEGPSLFEGNARALPPVASSNAAVSLGEALSQSARKWGKKNAVVYRHQPAIPDRVWTYDQLNDQAERVAGALLDRGFVPGDRMAIWGPNHAEWVLLEYALAKAGLILVALNPLYKLAELEFALKDSGAVGIFHADRIGDVRPADIILQARRNAPDLRHVYNFSSLWTDFMQTGAGSARAIPVDPDHLFMIQYTSGTTGLPKAVRLSHRAITTTARQAYQTWGLDENSRVCPGFPLFHVGGSGNSIPGAALVGATTLPLFIFKPSVTLDILEREACTAFIGVPTMVIAMLDDPGIQQRSFPELKTIILGGAPVTGDLLHRCQDIFGADIINCYGQTETCGVTTTTIPADSSETKARTSGRPLAGVSIAIRDSLGHSVPRGTVGELHYQGPGAMEGYGSTAGDAEHNDHRWIASGDLATMDAEGFITIAGRQKEMIIRGGENLSPLEIETYMKEHEAIRDVAVIAVPNDKYGEVACAVVRLREGLAVPEAEIRQWCSARISRWKVPEYIEFIDDFPLTPSGKIQKFRLQEQMNERLGLTRSVPG